MGYYRIVASPGYHPAFLHEALGGDHGGGAIRTRALGGIQEYKLMDLLQLILQLFDGNRGPAGQRGGFWLRAEILRGPFSLPDNERIEIPILRAAEERKMRVPLHCKLVESCFFSKNF